MLSTPDRLVLDVVGARLGQTAATVYDGVNRGGVINLRYSQFRPDVVRIVVDLDGPKTYHIDQSSGAIRITFGPAPTFQAWSSEAAGAARRVGRRRARRAGRAPDAGSRAGGADRSHRAPDPCRRAPHHRHLGPRQRRRRGGGFRRLQRPHHHPRQGHQGRSHGRNQESAVAPGLPGDSRHPGPLRPGDARRDHPRGLAVHARRPRFARAAGDEPGPDQLRPGRFAVEEGREHPDQGPRQGRGRYRLQLARSSPIPGAGSPASRDFVRGLDIRTPQLVDPGEDHLRRPDRPRAAGRQVRPGQQEPVLQQAGPAPRPGQAG